jgi:hypothetical protein
MSDIMNAFDGLDTYAAMAVRDALDLAVKELELRIKGEPPGGPQRDYFVNQRLEFLKAIEQLNPVRSDIHSRVWACIKASHDSRKREVKHE